MKIPFNPVSIRRNEMEYIREVFQNKQLSGDGIFTKKCSQLMEKKFNARKILLTTSCTHALEMAALLLNLQPGDEVITSSYTYPTTATSFCLRGAIPIFVDIREDTLNINEQLIEEKITPRTKAIFVVHYNGIACNMEKINDIAERYGLFVVEDAAQGVNAKYKGKYLGTWGHLGAYSFHDTKNYVCGEGGALVINDERFIERAEIIREKVTDRSRFLRGEIDKYTWVDIGSSYLPSELLAAFLYAQLEEMDTILKQRKMVYTYYYEHLQPLELAGLLRLPKIHSDYQPNYHIAYILLNSEDERGKLMAYLQQHGIHAYAHYHPLHDSKMGRSYGYRRGDLPLTEKCAGRLLRLPFYTEMTTKEQDIVIEKIKEFFGHAGV
jgi:dTDP-4-amino-4,6-dideoxygalactose transaminase